MYEERLGINQNKYKKMAKNEGFDVFNTLEVVHDEDILKRHRFLKGSGYVNYHIFDWERNCEINKTDINIIISYSNRCISHRNYNIKSST